MSVSAAGRLAIPQCQEVDLLQKDGAHVLEPLPNIYPGHHCHSS